VGEQGRKREEGTNMTEPRSAPSFDKWMEFQTERGKQKAKGLKSKAI